MNDYEYEKAAPKKPIRTVRRSNSNLYIDATGFCFAQHDVGFDEEIARRKTRQERKN